ncbi:GumC family protein [Pseudoalteromonas sp. SSM20]|uniref:GumC family protein n=1 Tax=Pseudoalteromonas sp. SSM20 TaxID=3139394 RepID=UPI003BA9C08E
MENVNSEAFDLKHYFFAVKKRFFSITFFSLLVTCLVGLYVMTISPIYQATSTIQIESKQARAVNFQQVYGVDFSRREYFETQFAILKSESIVREVINKLNLSQYPEFTPYDPSSNDGLSSKIKEFLPFLFESRVDVSVNSEEFKLQQMLDKFFRNLKVQPKYGTRLITVSYESADPELAALIVNTLTSTYIEREVLQKTGITRKASGWLNDRLSTLRVQLDQSEANLQAYREAEDLIDFEGSISLIRSELEQTSTQLIVAKNDLIKLENITRIINENGSNNVEQLESINEVTSHSAIQAMKVEVREAERKVNELAQVYGPKHPKMITARSEFEIAEQNLKKQIKSLISGIQKEVRNARANVVSLESSLKQLRSDYQSITRKETDYLKLKREVETNRNLYDAFLTRSKETEVSSDFSLEAAKVIDKAFVPTKPIKPNKKKFVLLAFIGSFAFSVGIVIMLTLLNDTVKTVNDVESKLAQRMLGLLPLQPTKKDKALDTHHFFNEDARQFAESIRTFRTSFVLSQMDRKNQVIEVTSSIPGEGKSTTSSNLAFSLAQIEKVLLIDADMRKPSICKRFNVPAYHPGLANFIAGTNKFDECLFVDEKSGLTIMPCGQVPPNPLELLSSSRFAKMIEHLRTKFDKIIIDTAPTQVVSDSLVIAQHVDSVIYVVKADSTRIGMVKAGLGRMIETKANIAGIVLNQVDLKRAESYGGYHGYYDYYGYGVEQKS